MNLRTIALPLWLLLTALSCSEAPALGDLESGRDTFTSQRDRVHIAQARRFLAEGAASQARRELQGVSEGAQNADMFLLLAEADLRENKINAANESIARAAELDPNNPHVDMLRGTVFELTGNWVEASKSYLSASTKDPDGTASVLANARALHAQGEMELAADYLQQELAARPIDFELSLAAGRAFMAVGSYFDAITHFSTAADMRQESLAAREGLVLALSLSGMHGEAVDRVEDLQATDLDPMLRLAVGRSALLVNQPERATAMLSSYLLEFEEDASAWLDLARAYYLSGEQALAASAVSRTLELHPQDQAAYTLLGHIHARIGQQDLAIAAYEQAILNGGDEHQLTELIQLSSNPQSTWVGPVL